MVVFQILMVVSLPLGDPSTLVAQGSPPPLLAVGAVVGANVRPALNVGNGKGVLVGRGVFVGASVGGNGVAVGAAACVCATMVKAAATAVFCTSAAFIVGAAGDPQALMIKVMARTMVKVEKRFILCDYLL